MHNSSHNKETCNYITTSYPSFYIVIIFQSQYSAPKIYLSAILFETIYRFAKALLHSRLHFVTPEEVYIPVLMRQIECSLYLLFVRSLLTDYHASALFYHSK